MNINYRAGHKNILFEMAILKDVIGATKNLTFPKDISLISQKFLKGLIDFPSNIGRKEMLIRVIKDIQ
jgi:hypothetical protein